MSDTPSKEQCIKEAAHQLVLLAAEIGQIRHDRMLAAQDAEREQVSA